jgi:thiamine pyrophosphate-dependent acetolactate synthase large subunit-like protein
MMTGITTAFSDKTPVFIITGDAEVELQGRGDFQDTTPSNFDANTFLMPVTNKRLVISHMDTLIPHVDSLFRHMLGTNRGPVQLTLPANFEVGDIETPPRKISQTLYHPRFIDKTACQKIGGAC